MTKKQEEKGKQIKVTVEGTEIELQLGEYLPMNIMQKDHKGLSFVPVTFIREIMRQTQDIYKIKSITYSEPRILLKGINKNGVEFVSLTTTCTLQLDDGRVYEGLGAGAYSVASIISDAFYGNLSVVRSRAYKDALKYVDKIYEFPQEEIEYEKGIKSEGQEQKTEQKTEQKNNIASRTEERDMYIIEGTPLNEQEAIAAIEAVMKDNIGFDEKKWKKEDILKAATKIKDSLGIKEDTKEKTLMRMVVSENFIRKVL